jgi:lysophospholipase L1-like esterase/energy-converting hydrogenase Eha subunit F
MAIEEDTGRAPGPRIVAALLAVIVLVQVWAEHAADPDILLPDPFRWIVVIAVALFGAASLLRHPATRRTLFTLSLAIPLLIVAFEVGSAIRPVQYERIAPSSDPLLRYTYRPGAWAYDRDPGAPRMQITPDGLWDEPHPVPRPAGMRRVVVLGDSVPNDGSIPFAKRFPRRLQELLSAAAPPGGSCDVVNVSCEGYSTLQEVRLYEQSGRRYQPDLIVVAYVLNDPFLQNGGQRRVGNSFFAFRFAPLLELLTGGSTCSLFQELNAGYAFELVVRSSLERLRMIAERDGTRVLVAPLPLVAPFDDPVCLAQYDHVIEAGRSQGFEATRLVDAFRGEPHERYLKAGEAYDVTHPNAEGHERIASRLASVIAPMLWKAGGSP